MGRTTDQFTEETSPSAWELALLGGFGLRRRDTGITHVLVLGDKSQRRLLAYLALHPQNHNRAELAALLWPDKSDDPAKARAALRVTLRRLRDAHPVLDASLAASGETLQLAPTLRRDVARFETLLKRRGADRIAALSAAVTLYQGDLLPGWQELTEIEMRAEMTPLSVRRYALQQQCAGACAELMGHFRALGDDGNAAAYARRALGLAAPETQPDWLRAAKAILQGATIPRPSARPAARRSWPLHLPALIGREAEMDALRRWLREPDAPRVFTLVGVGGIGKTRIAQAFVEAQEKAREFRVAVVPLGDWHDPGRVLSHVGGALYPEAAPPDDPVTLWKRFSEEDERPAVLVLDTLEHLVAGDAGDAVRSQLTRARREAPGLRILVTSQVRLGLAEETVCRVRPLSLPPRESASLPQIEAAESVQLFLRAANRSASALNLSPRSAPALARLCRLLNGHPLALRLAAAQFPGETLSALLEQIERGLARLRQRGARTQEPDMRHASLEQVIAWSFGLLPPEQQQGFLALSVFRGGFTAAAVAAVCGADAAAHLPAWEQSALLDLAPEEASSPQPRYHVLESLHTFATGRLPPEEQQTLARAYRAHFATVAEQEARHFRGPEALAALAVVRAEMPNFRHALELQEAAQDWEELARTVAGISALIFPLPRVKELLKTPLESALSARSALTPLTRARLLLTATNLTGDEAQEVHRRYLDEATRLAEAGGDVLLQVEISVAQAMIAPDSDRREAFARLALETADKDRDPYWRAAARHRLAGVRIRDHDSDAGIALYREALDISSASGSPILSAVTSNALASALNFACLRGDLSDPEVACAEILDYTHRAYDVANTLGLELLCAIVCATQQTALWMRGESQSLYRQAQRGLAHLRAAGGSAMVEGQLLRMLGASYILQGKWRQAATNLLLALKKHEGYDPFHQSDTLLCVGYFAARRGEAEDAARLAGAIIALHPPGETFHRQVFAHDPLYRAVRDTLGADRWEALLESSARLDRAAALAAARTYLNGIPRK